MSISVACRPAANRRNDEGSRAVFGRRAIHSYLVAIFPSWRQSPGDPRADPQPTTYAAHPAELGCAARVGRRLPSLLGKSAGPAVWKRGGIGRRGSAFQHGLGIAAALSKSSAAEV